MKRLLVLILVLAAFAALTLWGNQLIGRALDAELAPRLSRALGLPVTLAPVSAHLLGLSVRSPKLVMGDPQDPAVVATDVTVTLAWDDLWQREIRLVRVSATELMVRPSRWPSSGSPPPVDYRFLDPWLPKSLQLASGRFVTESGDAYPVDNLQWQRLADGSATASGSTQGPAGTIDLNATAHSLQALLALAPVKLELDATVAGKPESRIELKASVQPGTTAAYAAEVDIEAAAMSAQVTTSGPQPWALPDQSTTTIPLLAIEQLKPLVQNYLGADEERESAGGLASPLPSFHLPEHRGHVLINELRINDEIARENAFDFSTGEQGLRLSSLTSQGPEGILSGELAILSGDEGWTATVDTNIRAHDLSAGAALQFTGADWLWRTGHARLSGSGKTLDALLNSLTGDVALEGQYNGAVEIPITLAARLDNHPEEFALDQIALTVGEGQLSGSARLSGTSRRLLALDMKGTAMDLVPLLPKDAGDHHQPGIGVPLFLGRLPDMDLNLSIELGKLKVPGLNLTQAKATLQRNEQGGSLVARASGASFGSMEITLDATTPADKPTQIQLGAIFTQLDIADLFGQPGAIHSRSDGNLKLHSQGSTLLDIFAALQGQAKVTTEIRADNNWRRGPSAEEKLALSGNASLMLKGERIVGLKIEKLDVDSIEQDLTGNLTVASDREPWLVADLESDMLNVTGLLALLPSSAQQADKAGLVPSLERLGATRISLDAKTLTVNDVSFSNALLKVSSAPNVMTIDQFDFVSQDLTLRTQGKLTWRGTRASLESTARLTDVDLDRFLIDSPDIAVVPVSGTVQLRSEGSRIEELMRNVTGAIDLSGNAPPNSSPQSQRRLVVTASRLDDGVQADISRLQWGESELAANIRYHRTSPPTVEVELNGGTLTLLPWENAYLSGAHRQPARTTRTDLDTVARDSADLLQSILLAPLRLLGSDDARPPRTRVFSTDPISVESLRALNMSLSGQLDALISTEMTARDLKFNGQLRNGQLAVQASSDQIGGGSGEVSLTVDSTASPPGIGISSTFKDVRGIKERATFPRSGFVSLQSRGQSQAELAANVNGLIFLDLGRGPFDYANSALLTANLLTTMVQTLIPGVNRQQHQLECGTVLGSFKDGQGNTPYGFAARTNQANLVGHLSVDLRTEQMQMNIDSRGRQGMGLSVGSIFSNTVQIRGPLTNPGIVPNATGIAWRAWAAVTTGGLSILGESLLRRIWSSENPCKSVKRIIVENECTTNPIAASSPMICPKS